MLKCLICVFLITILLIRTETKEIEMCKNCSDDVSSTEINDISQAINYVTPTQHAPSSLHTTTEDLRQTTENDESNVTLNVIPLTTQEPKSRAINFALDPGTSNIITTNNSTNNILNKHHTVSTIYVTTSKSTEKDISDVSMDDEDEVDSSQLIFTENPKLNAMFHILHNKSLSKSTNDKGCTYEKKMYKIGEKLEKDCDEVCTCIGGGKMDCKPRCVTPFFRKGRQNDDKACIMKEINNDPCCALLVCTSETVEAESSEMCIYNNKTYQIGETFNEECKNVCTCELMGRVSCKPRCSPIEENESDKCVSIPDPQDLCCTILRCDVTLNDTGGNNQENMYRILSITALNSSTIKLNVDNQLSLINVQFSEDKHNWNTIELTTPDYMIKNLKPHHKYFIRTAENASILQIDTPGVDSVNAIDHDNIKSTGKCEYKGQKYNIGEEFHDNCTSYCICTNKGTICDKINCPTKFGLDVLDPHCLEWETVPPNFVPKPPHCCAERVQCKNNGSCLFEGVRYNNFVEIPSNLTGCHRRCYCELGKIECQEICPPVTAQPPGNLPCPPHHAILTHLQDDDCCLYWVCTSTPSNSGAFIPALQNGIHQQPIIPSFNPRQDEINVMELKAIDPYTVRLILVVPPVLVGLHGRVELRYTHLDNDNPSTWEVQVFAPPNDLIATSQLEFELPGLKPDTEYKIKINILLHDLHNTLSSKIYKVKTMALSSYTTTPSIIPILPDLKIVDINSTWITLTWRKFTDYELQYIDGIQIRYKKIHGKIYSATPLIHRAITSYTLENLKSSTEYEIEILFIPFQGQQTELKSETVLYATTLPEIDLYNFNVTIEIKQIKPRSVEIIWSGIPYPQEKYVNIYRAIYESESEKENFSTFKIAKRDSPSKTIITDLKPNTKYQLWLELYLSNGKIRTSNIVEFKTKEDLIPQQSIKQGQLSGIQQIFSDQEGPSDYYEPLVIVAIVAAIAILATLVLSSVLMKRYSQNKAAISSPTTATRVAQASYDNPTYKAEVQQETMNL